MSRHSGVRLSLAVRLVLAGALAASTAGAQAWAGECGSTVPTAPLPRCMTPADVGIESPSDIESAVIKFYSGETYQLTFKACPDLTAELYRALLSLGTLETQGMPGNDDLLILNAKGGEPRSCASLPTTRLRAMWGTT